MDKAERQNAEVMRDRLKKILPDLKLAYENAKDLADKYNWDICCIDMCEAYMNLADEYIGVMEAFEEEDEGDGQ